MTTAKQKEASKRNFAIFRLKGMLTQLTKMNKTFPTNKRLQRRLILARLSIKTLIQEVKEL